MDKAKQVVKKLPSSIAILLITFYRVAISPLFPSCCRFTPTCSEYGISAIKKYGILKGTLMAGRRLLRCRPGGPEGYDPVP
jgi:uncharacterized protein